MSSSGSKNNPDFTFQCSPDIVKSYGQQIAIFDKANEEDAQEFSHTERKIQQLIKKNKNELSYDSKSGTDEINKNLNTAQQQLSEAPQSINPFLKTEESKTSRDRRPSIKSLVPYYKNSHSIQNYLRMLELKTVKGDLISVESQNSEDECKQYAKQQIINMQRIGSAITKSDIESNIITKNNNQDQNSNYYCSEFSDNQTDFDQIFKLQYSIICRICKKQGFKTEDKDHQIINPCSCQAPNYWVHNACLEDEIRQNIQNILENPNQSICCKMCSTPYSLSLFKYRNWSRYRELLPCFLFLLSMVGLMLYFFVQLILEVTQQSISISSALINFYIVVFIIIICMVIIYISLKMLEQVKLKINRYQKSFQTEQEEQNQETLTIIKYLKQTNGQFL
ncbi:RING-variant domain protein (macronuclear) [Tetrahymena thermophila SB210]|uniref:RING-variant domain protein n=1 Tax=Tetrahymena thermophila (strain SB210) TaxID=312017 RepID=Q22UX4_TETTS|nr:RING-variant domain protein [Tetrahymena thermophila SB210]EAR89174.1 RING-variant domain protein [Tetrahymena thermophila SB210]|eukprot:XP_001009419.1 RING-variant domain protein [Tetrahymena thermophila SB210]